jgi:hemolysin D
MTARITDGALAFQADLDRLVAEPAPLGLRLWPLLGAGLVLALLIVASVVRIDIVVVASGRLAADAPSVILQPMTRAVLTELLVKPGDRVLAGQVLARLDSTLTDADRAALEVERRALSAKVARLQAELSGDAMASGGADLAMEAAVMTQRADLAAAQRNQLAAAIQSLHQQIAAETGAGAGLTERQEIAREIEGMRAALAQRQSGSHLAALEARLVRIEAETAFDQHFARLDDLRQRLAQAEAALSAFESDRKRLLTEALAEVVPRLAEVEEQLTKADRLAALADLRAPLPGVVLSVAKGGPGSLMAESDPVVVLVPTDVPLIAEIGIKSSEAGTIAMGDPVTIKVDAFPWRRNGSLTGVLQDVSHGSFTPEGGTQALHSGRVTLSGGLSDLAPGAGLLPGMTVSAEIKTGTRTILDYFLDPLMRGMTESLREP